MILQRKGVTIPCLILALVGVLLSPPSEARSRARRHVSHPARAVAAPPTHDIRLHPAHVWLVVHQVKKQRREEVENRRAREQAQEEGRRKQEKRRHSRKHGEAPKADSHCQDAGTAKGVDNACADPASNELRR